MNIRLWIYAFLLIALVTDSCKNNDDEEQRLTWSTEAPLSIPYRVRLQRYERGNMVRNHSFENGKIFKLDSATTSFAIDGWQLTGENIEWTDIRMDSIYKKDEAFSGFRAVKISRQKALETDTEGEGILSDFIKVIPGNYSLSLYVRLENVMPLRARLGTRMYDAVGITLQFYDRNRNLMNPSYNYPMAGQVVNTSFKGLSFANYKTISSFGWAKVIGKSHSFPFPEGDIPSDAHFVRIFIGLKGTGTLWVDSVNFGYTRRNFSVSERMQKYTDTSFHTPEVLIPEPKEVSRLESIIFYKPGIPESELPVILAPDNEVGSTEIAGIVRDAFSRSMSHYESEFNGDIARIINDEYHAGNSRLIISVGKTSAYLRYREKLPIEEIRDYRDGYFIYSPPDDPRLVILGANNDTGLFYAALTTVQMIDSKQPLFHNNRIIDYPDFPYRYFTVQKISGETKGILEQLREYKFNGTFILAGEEPLVEPESSITPEYFSLTPVTGYVAPENQTLTYKYPLNRNATLISSQGNLVIPPVFHNEMLDNSDYSEICCQVTVDAKPVYSGSSFFSLNTDASDISRFSAVMGPRPVFMDNSMLIHTEWSQFGGNTYYPGKLRLYNIFEPFMNQEIREFFSLLDSNFFVVNLSPHSEINRIRLATAADFLWNSESWSPDYSIWKVLMTMYGAENARELIRYADKYAVLLEAIARVELKNQLSRNIRIAQQTLVDLTTILAGLSENLGNRNQLVTELQGMNSALRQRLGNLQPPARK